MWQYVILLSLKPTKVTLDFILNYLKKVVGDATTKKYQTQILKPFLKFVPFWGNSSTKLNSFICKKKSDFLTPLAHLGPRPYRFEQK